MLSSPATSNASLGHGHSQGFWGKFKPKTREPERRENPVQMALQRQRLLTLCFGDQETIRMLPTTFAELEDAARDWSKPPPDAQWSLRVPVEFASLHAARLVSGPYIYLTGEDSYQIAMMGVQGLRVEIVSDAPPPPDEPPPPPPEPVLEMPATFNLELAPGQHVALDVDVRSDELDMARMDDGTTVDGIFWGKLDIVHDGDNHQMEFSGTRVPNGNYAPDFLVDNRLITKLATATKPATAKCNLILLAPERQICDIFLTFSSMWKLGVTWPPAERVPDAENKVKYFLQVHPGGALEHYESQMVTTALYYEAMPDPNMMEPSDYVAPRNGFAMPTSDFLAHIMDALDQLGLSLHARTNFLNSNMSAFTSHKNVAYRFLSPSRIAAAIDITVTTEPCIFTRLFLIFRGLTDDEADEFAGAGEKEANTHNWRETVGWNEDSKDPTMFRVLELSVLEVT